MAVRAHVSGANDAAGTSHSISLPAGVVSGDRLIVCVSSDTDNVVSTSSTGWSAPNAGSVAQGANHRATIFTKVATGSDALTVDVATSAQEITWISLCMQGDGGTPTVQSASGASATTATIAPISGLASGDYDSIVFVSTDAGSTTSQSVTMPAGWTNPINRNPGTTSSAATFSANQTLTGVTGATPGSATLSVAEQWVTWHVMVPAVAGGGSGAPAWGNAGTYLPGASGTSAVVAKPAGTVENDILVVYLYREITAAVTAPGGFTLLSPPATDSTGDVVHASVYWKRAGPSEPADYTFSWTGSNWRAAVAFRISGTVASGSPVDAWTNGASPSSMPALSLTTTGPNRLLIWIASNYSGTQVTPPAGYTTRVDPADRYVIIATAEQASAGGTGSVTGSGGGSTRAAHLLAIAPPATGNKGAGFLFLL